MLYSRYCNKFFQNDATQEYKFKYPANRMLYSRYCKYAFKNDTKIYINNEKEIHGVCVWKIVCFYRFINKQYFIKYIAQYICNILSVSKKNDIGLWQTYSTIIFARPMQYRIFYISNILSASNNIYCKYIGQYVCYVYCKYIVQDMNIFVVSNKSKIYDKPIRQYICNTYLQILFAI